MKFNSMEQDVIQSDLKDGASLYLIYIMQKYFEKESTSKFE